MSAIRYCGNVRIRVTYVEPRCGTPKERKIQERYPHGRYRCAVILAGQQPVIIWTAPPACLPHAVDCSDAFDGAAHAALSFTDDEPGTDSIIEQCELNDVGWVIRRSPIVRVQEVSNG